MRQRTKVGRFGKCRELRAVLEHVFAVFETFEGYPLTEAFEVFTLLERFLAFLNPAEVNTLWELLSSNTLVALENELDALVGVEVVEGVVVVSAAHDNHCADWVSWGWVHDVNGKTLICMERIHSNRLFIVLR